MSERLSIAAALTLEYWSGRDVPDQQYQSMPVEPEHTNELVVALRSDEEDDSRDPRAPLFDGRPQVHLAGSPRALEALGLYLIALARLATEDPDPHEHFEDVQNGDGGTVHLIIHRS